METPPSYAPPKKSNTGLIIGLVLGGIAICCIGGVALLGFFGLNFFNKTVAPMAACMASYEAVASSISAYADDHGGKLPSASAWQDELAPYVEKQLAKKKKENSPFKVIEPNGEWSCTFGDKKTGLAYNVELDGKALADARRDNKIVIFEVEEIGRNLSQKYTERDKSSSPKLFGERRGWITINAASGLQMNDQTMNSGKFDFDEK
jgi:hypothetical protein